MWLYKLFIHVNRSLQIFLWLTANSVSHVTWRHRVPLSVPKEKKTFHYTSISQIQTNTYHFQQFKTLQSPIFKPKSTVPFPLPRVQSHKITKTKWNFFFWNRRAILAETGPFYPPPFYLTYLSVILYFVLKEEDQTTIVFLPFFFKINSYLLLVVPCDLPFALFLCQISYSFVYVCVCVVGSICER